jgi:hypothetical protein
MERVKERFESYVVKEDSGCWRWTGGKAITGYGVFFYNKLTQLAHRVSYKLYHSKEIDPGLLVCHSCTNKHCVAPEHLSLGSRTKNNGPDRRRDGTDCSGSRCHFSKLTWDSVRAIRTAAEAGETRKSIAAKYAVTLSTVSAIIRKKSWKESTPEQTTVP